MNDLGTPRVGDIVRVLDSVDLTTETVGTIRMIEPDNEIPGLCWIYIVANYEPYNTNFDPRIGNYWKIFEMDNKYISLVRRATTE
jgi:hypothetical protein